MSRALDVTRPPDLQRTPLLAEVAATLRLLDGFDRLQQRLAPLLDRVRSELGLTVAELSALRALAAGGDPGPEVAALATAGLVDGTRISSMRVSELGRVRLAQADALLLRVTDVAAAVLGPADAGELARLLDRLADGLPADQRAIDATDVDDDGRMGR